jgi:hypothetical protein
MSPSAESVITASNAWLWVPDNAVSVETSDYLLVRYPDYFDHALELIRFKPAGPVEDAMAAVLDRARQFARPALHWMVRLDGPAGVPELLEARGATVGLSADNTDCPAPSAAGVELRWQTDIATARDAAALDVAVFGGSMPPEDCLAKNAARDSATVPAGEGGRLVAYVDGAAVGTGGVTMADEVARLWGGGVAEKARRRGVYRAILAARLAYGASHGATMALVKARIETSGPILRRAGFAAYGQERIYRVPLSLEENSVGNMTIPYPAPITRNSRTPSRGRITVVMGEGSKDFDNARGKTARGDLEVLRAGKRGCRNQGRAVPVQADHGDRPWRCRKDAARAACGRWANGCVSRRRSLGAAVHRAGHQ